MGRVMLRAPGLENSPVMPRIVDEIILAKHSPRNRCASAMYALISACVGYEFLVSVFILCLFLLDIFYF
jgi:hypothetical protein